MTRVVIGSRNRVLATEDTYFLSGTELVSNFSAYRDTFDSADAIIWAWYALGQDGRPDIYSTLRGTEAILNSIQALNLNGIFLSTDAVFSGRDGSYSETDKLSPQTDYARIKVAQEALMAQFSRLRFTTFGPSFNPMRGLLIEMIASSAINHCRPNQFFSPISTTSLNRVIDEILGSGAAPQLYHLTSQRISKSDCCYHLAKNIGVTLPPFLEIDMSSMDLSLKSHTHSFDISDEIALATSEWKNISARRKL